MSAYLDQCLSLDHSPEEIAALDEHATMRRIRCAPAPIVLSAEAMEAMDETAEWGSAQ